MPAPELIHNPRVIAGTLAGFEGFSRLRALLVDPLRDLLPIAVELERVAPEVRPAWSDAFRARGFFVDDRDDGDQTMRIAAPLDRFRLLADVRDAAPGLDAFVAAARAAAAAVEHRFRDAFDLRLRSRVLRLGRKPLVMGVLNVTPDSFSDGGRTLDPARAIDHGLLLEMEGADLVDVGAESTRPGAPPVAADEEMERLLPVVKALVARLRVPLSIDTRKSEVAERCLALGAELINDVSGLEFDPRMAEVVSRRQGALVLNHMRGTPQSMQEMARYDDPVADIGRELRGRLERARRAGIADDRIVLDPGIGFGKRLEDNLDVLARIEELRSIGRPLLLGCSRKSFLGRITGREVADRDAATAATTALAALRGVKMVRVHDVAAAVDVLSVLDAVDERLRPGQ